MGEMMGPLFSVITIALLSSWLLSLTMVALLAVFFIRVKQQASQSEKSTFIGRLNGQYKELLLKALERPYSFMGIIAGLFVLSLFGFGFLPFIFFSRQRAQSVDSKSEFALGHQDRDDGRPGGTARVVYCG